MSESVRKEKHPIKLANQAVASPLKLAGFLDLKRTLRHDDGSIRILYPLPLFSVVTEEFEDVATQENMLADFNQNGLILPRVTPDRTNTNIVHFKDRQMLDYDKLFPPESIYAHAKGAMFKQSVAADPKKELAFVRLADSDMVAAYTSGVLAVKTILGEPHGLRYDFPEALDEQQKFTPEQFRKI